MNDQTKTDPEVQEPQAPHDQWPYKAWLYFAILCLFWAASFLSVKRAYFPNGWFSRPYDEFNTWLDMVVVLALFVIPFLHYCAVMAFVEQQDLARQRDFRNQQRLKQEEKNREWLQKEIKRVHEAVGLQVNLED